MDKRTIIIYLKINIIEFFITTYINNAYLKLITLR